LSLDMLGVFAEFETNLRRERQLEGIAKAKVEGRSKGCKPSVDVATVRRLKAQGFGPTDTADQLGIGRASVYRALGGDPQAVALARQLRQSNPNIQLRAIAVELQAQGFAGEDGAAYSADEVATMVGHGLGRYMTAG
jgi:hypothetical protein